MSNVNRAYCQIGMAELVIKGINEKTDFLLTTEASLSETETAVRNTLLTKACVMNARLNDIQAASEAITQ